jgi:hypothetical protein
LQKDSNSELENWGPLSEIKYSGNPNLANIGRRAAIVVLVVASFILITSNHFVRQHPLLRATYIFEKGQQNLHEYVATGDQDNPTNAMELFEGFV